MGLGSLLLTLQLGACGAQQPDACGGPKRPHPEIGGELLYTCYAAPQIPGGLFLLDVATGHVQRLTPDRALNQFGAWSPHGSEIVFLSTRDGREDIYVMGVPGKAVRRLTNGFGFNGFPSWSPDGSWIAFDSGRAGVKGPVGAAGFHSNIYLMRPDGSDARRLTSWTGYDGYPIWSPDGSRLAFVSDRGGALDVYTMRPAGSDQRQLTHHEGGRGLATFPSWSPDGSEIVFDASNPAGDAVGASLYRISAGGGEVTRVTRGYDYRPTWSPDGSWIAFLASRHGHTQLFAVRPDGSGLTQLTTDDGDKDLARWQPD